MATVTICRDFESESESRLVMTGSLWPHELYSPWNSPDQNSGVGSFSLLQGIFPTQESNRDLLHCRWILGDPSDKIYHYFRFFPLYLPWSDVTGCQDLSFWMLSLKPGFSLSLTLIRMLFSSSLLSAIRVVSSAYLKQLIFLLAILIPAYDSSSPAFHWCTQHIS